VNEPESSDAKQRGPVVAIGASAGGLRALQDLFGSLPSDTGMTFVVVQHLSPDFESVMDELLAKHTTMPIHIMKEGMPLEPDQIYLNSPKAEASIAEGRFTFDDVSKDELRLPINAMFHSIANQYGQDAVGVILSGTGSDGTKGLKRIHRLMGLTIVQSPESAQFDGMPRSAIATDHVDFVAGPVEIAELLRKHSVKSVSQSEPVETWTDEGLTGIQLIFSLLSKVYGIDFAHYKPTTVARRIDRRLKLSRFGSLQEYSEVLRNDAGELDLLYHDLLIGVTKFFRDLEAFEVLRQQLVKQINTCPTGETLRVWSVGCASGQEAYSIGILLFEIYDELGRTPDFKVFATDVHERTLEIASRGVYQPSEVSGLSDERSERFFSRQKNGEIRVKPFLRNHLVFAKQNVVKDPPFTQIHVLTCRNLLIYLQEDFQAAAIYSFRFALRDQGLMMLGPSETVGRLAPGFDVIDKNWRLFRKNEHPISKLHGSRAIVERRIENRKPTTLQQVEHQSNFAHIPSVARRLISEFVTSALLVDEDHNILHVFGSARAYLSGHSGPLRGSLLEVLGEESGKTIAIALTKACHFIGSEFRCSNLKLCETADARTADVTCKAFNTGKAGQPIVLLQFFDHGPSDPNGEADKTSTGDTESAPDLSNVIQDEIDLPEDIAIELANARESLGATIEQLEASNQELQSTNEELIASNEELQATNEELQSVNEELHTVNVEHQKKVLELEEITGDFNNLFNSTGVGSILLDEQLNIRKFTREATSFFSLLEHDIGRPLANFACKIKIDAFSKKIRDVMETGQEHTEYAADIDDRWLEITIAPYRTNHQVRGVIINLIELTQAVEQWKNRLEPNKKETGTDETNA
jgi:two-component system CheB/CheR fusion protein